MEPVSAVVLTPGEEDRSKLTRQATKGVPKPASHGVSPSFPTKKLSVLGLGMIRGAVYK